MTIPIVTTPGVPWRSAGPAPTADVAALAAEARRHSAPFGLATTLRGDGITTDSGPPEPTPDDLCRAATGHPTRRALRSELARLRRLRARARKGSLRR